MASPPDSSASTPDVALHERFELIERLGAGASGIVHRARLKRPLGELPVGAEVAVKVLHPNLVRDADARRQLAQEAEVGRTVRSDAVVRIFAAEPTYIVMEFVAGRTLRQFLQESGPVLGALARRIGEHAARGLHALHRLGIVHRDVKPENLLWTDSGSLILMDLGLARADAKGPGSSSAGFHGSFAYAAPEVLRGRPYGPAADLYALGIVLFEVVTGRHPFADAAQSPDAMIHAHLEQTPPRASHYTPGLATLVDVIIGELLSKTPEDRFGTALQLARTLESGESSKHWRERERRAPVLGSRRRLQALRRPAPTRFIGRRREREVLDRALRTTRQGKGRAIRIVGPAGVGRRRLCDERIEAWLRDRPDILFLGGRADRRSADLPATPFPQIVRDWLLRGDAEGSPNAAARAQNRAVDRLGWEDGDAARLAAIVTGQDQKTGPATRADLLVRAVVSITGTSPVAVLRIDRAERLDAAGALVQRALIDAAAERPLLLLINEPANDQKPSNQGPGTVLEITGMKPQDFVDLGTALFRNGEAATSLLREAHEALTGHPGALIDSLEELEQDALLRGRPGDYHDLAHSVSDLHPARSAMQRLRDRVRELPVNTRYVLQFAAVLGRDFALDDLVSLVGQPEIEVLAAIASIDGRLIRTVRGGRGVFAHRDIRRALLDSIPIAARRRMHRAAGWLREDLGASPIEVGMHFSRAGLDAECVPPLLAGLQRIVATGSRRVGLRIIERLRLHLGRLPRNREHLEQRLRLQTLSARSYSSLGDSKRGRNALRKALALSTHLGDAIASAQTKVSLAELEQANGHFLVATQLIHEAMTALSEGPDSSPARAASARALGIQSRIDAYQGDVDSALTAARRGRDLVPEDQPLLAAHLAIDLARWRALHTHFRAADRSFRRAEDFVDASGDAGARMRLTLHRARFYDWLGATTRAGKDFDACETLARRLDEPRILSRAALFRAEAAVFVGEGASVASELEYARAASARVGDQVTEAQATALLAITRVHGPATLPPVDDVGVPYAQLIWTLARAVHARRHGDPTAARDAIGSAGALGRMLRTPLPVRIALLRLSGREGAARRLPENVVSRLPDSVSRRRFLALAARWRLG